MVDNVDLSADDQQVIDIEARAKTARESNSPIAANVYADDVLFLLKKLDAVGTSMQMEKEAFNMQRHDITNDLLFVLNKLV